MPATPPPPKALATSCQPAVPKNMALQSSAQALMNALQPKISSKSTPPEQTGVTKNESVPSPTISLKKSTSGACESEKSKINTLNAAESSRALKEFLVISAQKILVKQKKLKFSESIGCAATTVSSPSALDNSEDPSPVHQKEKKTKLSRQRTKSRSNSEDADFYAGSAILNSPSPNAIPLPDFDEICDFFTAENRLNCVGNVRVNLVR
jgi:hypothetical protein